MSAFNLSASERDFSEKAFRKVYFQLNDVQLDNDQILLNVDNDCIPISNILKDDRGFHSFVETEAAVVGLWTCPSCSTPNSMFDKTCRRCGYECFPKKGNR